MLTVADLSERHEKERQRAEQEDRVERYRAGEKEHSPLVPDICDPEKQLGKPLSWKVLRKFIQKTNPSLSVEMHPHNNTKICVWLRHPSGQREHIITGESGLVPEWSLMAYEEKEIPAHNPERRVTPSQPATEWIKRPMQELKRGWRTLLAGLVITGYLPVEKVRQFALQHGGPDRQSWAALLGYQKEKVLL